MRSELTEEFENTAAWREEKAAVQGPTHATGGHLRHLAATADDVPLALMSEYRAVFLRWDTSEVVRLINETLRAVGFRTYPVDATAFVREFIELVNRDRRQFETFRPRVVTTLD
jgi:hypothetical protein